MALIESLVLHKRLNQSSPFLFALAITRLDVALQRFREWSLEVVAVLLVLDEVPQAHRRHFFVLEKEDGSLQIEALVQPRVIVALVIGPCVCCLVKGARDAAP